MDFAYYFRTKKSRFSSSGLCALLSYLKVAIFKPQLRKLTSRTTFVLKSCDFRALAAADKLFIWRNVKMAIQAQNVKIWSFGSFLLNCSYGATHKLPPSLQGKHLASFWAWRSVKMAIQAENVKILLLGSFLGLASRLTLLKRCACHKICT